MSERTIAELIISHFQFLVGTGLGVMHVTLVDTDLIVSYAPVDYVNNAIIAAGWDSVKNRHLWNSIPMYTVSSSPYNTKWGESLYYKKFYITFTKPQVHFLLLSCPFPLLSPSVMSSCSFHPSSSWLT